jgi:predicted short-subunit dehydrogenase-like oxidoreductase (DUF2520 family)
MSLRVAVIGAGRMGQGLALALSRSGAEVTLLGRTAKPVPEPLTLQVADWRKSTGQADVVLVATPDAAIPSVATRLARDGGLGPRQSVLHLSGLLTRDALAPLAGTGAGLGSFHPLQTMVDPLTAQARLRGAYVGVEGDEQARAAGATLAGLLGMTPVIIPAEAKARYHAGATLVANYTVALMGMAVRLAEEAGVPQDLAQRFYLPLLHGATENLEQFGPVTALTGAIRRGDSGTVEAHLAALSAGDRVLYAVVGLEALALARRAGLDAAAATELERVLRAAATGR